MGISLVQSHIGILFEMETAEAQTTLRQAQGERDRGDDTAPVRAEPVEA